MVREGGIYKQFQVEWVGRDGLSPDTHERYLNEFVNHFYKHVLKLVDRAMKKEDNSEQVTIFCAILLFFAVAAACFCMLLMPKLLYNICRVPGFEPEINHC